MVRLRSAVVLLALLAACSDEEPRSEPTSASSSALIGGAVDNTSWPAVGFLFGGKDRDEALTKGEGCTATLIGPNVVLTAAHCIEHPDPVFGFGTGKVFGGNRYFAVSRTVQPDYPFKKGSDWKADIAYIVLESAVPDIAPMKIGAPGTGCSAQIIGYGRTVTDEQEKSGINGYTNERKTAQACYVANPWEKDVVTVESTVAGICPGDSGSPIIDRDRNIIVAAAATATAKCEIKALAGYTSTVVYADFIQQGINEGAAYLAQHAPQPSSDAGALQATPRTEIDAGDDVSDDAAEAQSRKAKGVVVTPGSCSAAVAAVNDSGLSFVPVGALVVARRRRQRRAS